MGKKIAKSGSGMKSYGLTLNLKNDEKLIKEYLQHHEQVWPEVVASIEESGILSMEIYRFGTLLFMRIQVKDDFSFEKKAAMDSANDRVIEWEQLMWSYQEKVEGSKTGEKWVLMDEVFKL